MKKRMKKKYIFYPAVLLVFCCCCLLFYLYYIHSVPDESVASGKDEIGEVDALNRVAESPGDHEDIKAGDGQDDRENRQNQEQTVPDLSGAQPGSYSLPADSSLIELISILQSPLPGAKVTNRDTQLPGAPREYRNGTHEGLDLYDGYCSIPIHYGDPVYAAGDGVIQRIDHNYTELVTEDRDEILRICAELPDTPADYLDLLRGRQVWILHPNGIMTFYAHLSNTADLEAGDQVKAGDFIGEIGNSGTSDGALGNKAGAHLHFEVWIGDNYLGENLPPAETRKLLKVIFEK